MFAVDYFGEAADGFVQRDVDAGEAVEFFGDVEGLGEEALRAALKLAFEEMCRERVTLDHFAENEIASMLYLKTGFHYEGVMRHGGKKDGMYVDLHLMSMLREEYFAVNEK